MLIRIGYDIELALSAPTTVLAALHVHPSRAGDLQAPEQFAVEPALPLLNYQDGFDNTITRVDVPAGVGSVRFTNHAVVADSGLPDPVVPDARQHPLHELPLEVFRFLLPSRYCEVDSELMPFAWNRFGQLPEGWARVQAICDFAHRHIRFDYMQARANRTALQAWQEGVGVCRDYAHLSVTLCRCLNIPARYVTGYLGDIGMPPPYAAMDFAAWMEVYLGGQWHTFDARNNTPRIGRVLMARGRDAADVPITMVFGWSQLNRFEVITDEVAPAAPQPAP
ncbi:MAG: transglutaminase family protein [Ottowia sp.]|nr:transglutaminase family protein [Ottowia sp.]MBP7531695.1 transglutaminase family protein [Ottowia sp.]MBP7536022.1 transglutaminase family protein [Ottowia sp.]